MLIEEESGEVNHAAQEYALYHEVCTCANSIDAALT